MKLFGHSKNKIISRFDFDLVYLLVQTCFVECYFFFLSFFLISVINIVVDFAVPFCAEFALDSTDKTRTHAIPSWLALFWWRWLAFLNPQRLSGSLQTNQKTVSIDKQSQKNGSLYLQKPRGPWKGREGSALVFS